MQTKFEVVLSKTEYVVGLEALRGELARRDTTAQRRIYERLAAISLLFFAIGYFIPEAMTGLFLLIVATALLEWAMARRWTKSVHGISFDPSVYPATFDFGDEGITERSPLRRREWPWSAVRKLHDRGSALVLKLAAWDMIVLPNRLWPTPEERSDFLDWARRRLPADGDFSVVDHAAPSFETANWFTIAAFAAFVDTCLLTSFLLPPYTRRFGPLAEDVGFAGGMLLFLMISGAFGYGAYRATKAALPRLYARSPLAANILAQALIWASAVWFAAAWLNLI